MANRNIIFIDQAVIDYQSLIAGVQPDTSVVVLDSTRDGVEQITQALQGGKYQSVQIISHGSSGSLQLGSIQLNTNNLNSYTNQLQQWRNYLTDDADILLYGCNVASGDQTFVQQLSQITGADVAASDDITGNAELGGDWDLEVKIGEIESDLALTPEVTNAYISTLPSSFAAATTLNVGSSPYSVTVGDFNKDGNLDLATANYSSNNVSVLLGNGNGSFGSATNFSAGSGSFVVTVGDFNKDGNLDLATANYGSGNVSVLLGNGSGGFGAATNFSVGSSPYSVTVGDFNNDGKSDLAVANINSTYISVLLGNGSGGFGTASNVDVGGASSSVTVGDFNKDGKSDLAVANQGLGAVSVLLGNGSGGFGAATNFSAGSYPISVTVGDFNKDGNSDLATANNSNSVSVLLGNGSGSFAAATNFDVAGSASQVIVGDFDKDGNSDLATANSSSNSVSVLLGNGSGSFAAATTLAVGNYPYRLTAGDFNNDGKSDLATANASSNSVSVLLNTSATAPNTAPTLDNTGNPTLSNITQDLSPASNLGTLVSAIIATGAGGNPITDADTGAVEGIAVIGVDNTNGKWQYSTNGGSSWIDFSVSTTSATLLRDTASDRIRFLPNASFNGTANITFRAWDASDSKVSGTTNVNPGAGGGTTAFSSATETAGINISKVLPLSFAAATTLNVGSSPYSVTTGDFNKDGNLDLATANYGSSNVSVLLGNGNSSFGTATNFSAGSGSFVVTVGDFNNDGKSDIATANYGSNSVSVLLGNGTGGFGAASNFNVGSNPYFLTVGDFNNDGKSDLAVANINSTYISVLLGNGNGGFGTASNIEVGGTSSSVTVGDFNKDGKTDLAVANLGLSTVSVLLGNGSGGFGAATNFNVGSSPYSVTVGDFNKDGNSDLAVANNGSNTVSVLLGNGSGSFGAATNFNVGSGVFSVIVADFDKDGNSDLAVTNAYNNSVSVLLGNGSGSFGAATNLGVGNYPFRLTAGDFNNDGKSDLATANASDNTVSVLLNTSAASTPNTAPTLDNTGNPTLSNITQDLSPVSNLGTLVSAMIATGAGGNPITDADTGAVEGIAVIGVDNTNGKWQYSTNGGNSWIDFSVSTTSATLLRDTASDRIRFLPNASFNGTANITFRAWDASDSKVSGTTNVNPGAGGGTTAFSSATETAGINISKVLPLSFAAATTLNVGSFPYAVTTGDFNKDGNPDLAAANAKDNNVSVLFGNGSGGFATAISFGVGTYPTGLTAGDFNNDGKSDIATANTNSNSVSVLLSNGTGGFTTAGTFGVGASPANVTVGDFNNDGKSDLATANLNSNTVSVLLGNGSGGFATATTLGVGSGPNSVAVGDFNNDGKSDLAVANINSGTVSILLGNGSGGFATATSVGAGSSPFFVAVADFNKDGKSDLVVANGNSSGTVSVLLGNGSGGFGAATTFAVGSNPYSVIVGDFNKDGNSDIATANNGSGTVSVLLGNGSGGFATATTLGVGSGTNILTVGDYNKDGYSDLAVANIFSNSVSVLLNTTGPSNAAPILNNTGNPTLSAITEDLPTTSNPGTLVSAMIATGAGGNPITDADTGAVEGIAVIGVDNTNGKWQYSTNGGNNWNDFSVSTTSATLLRDTEKVRFLPNPNFNGTANITFRAWDASDSKASGTTNVDPGAGGGTTAFSSATETASINISSVDDSTFVVTNTNDSGFGSLRQAIIDANKDPGVETIVFDQTGIFGDNNPDIITLTSGELGITDEVMIQGTGANKLTISASNTFRIFNATASLSIDGLKLTGGKASTGNGGAILSNSNVTVSNSIISGNTAQYGGGIFTFRNATVNNSTISGNIAENGGGIFSFRNATVKNSTISGNTAQSGGGIFSNSVTLSNSTISGNQAQSDGGGINSSDGTISNSTITNNTTINGNGGGIFNLASGAFNISNSIIAGNFDTGNQAPDISGDNFNGAYNLIGNLDGKLSGNLGTGTDIVNPNPGLQTLASNGGSTQTHALNSTSLAVNSGNTGYSGDLTTDQRGTGFNRIKGTVIDIGAFESEYTNIPRKVSFGAATYNTTEDGTATYVAIAVTLNDTPTTDITVPIVINNASTATNNDDYTFFPTSVTFNAGATGSDLTQLITFTIQPDDLPENAEKIVLNFGTLTGVVPGAITETTLNIAANDPIRYAISADTTSLDEGNGGAQPVSFTVTRSGGTGVASRVDYALSGKALLNSDYNNIQVTNGGNTSSGTVNFEVGQTTATITVDVLGDNTFELDEDITATLSNPDFTDALQNSTTTAKVDIINDDNQPTISISNVSVDEGNTGTKNANFEITLSNASSEQITVNYKTSDGTAKVSDSDYNSDLGTIVFAPGETSKTVSIGVTSDTQLEANEIFNLNLSDATNATISNNLGVATIVNDDQITKPILINEILFHTASTDIPKEYIELRSNPGATLPVGTYLLAVDGNSGSTTGKIQNIFDLSGKQFGSNGFLVLLQKGSTYTANPNANVLTNTGSGAGWGNGASSSIGHTGLTTELPNGSVSFLLIQTFTPPTLGNDIDSNNDGNADGTAYSSWTVLDSVSVLDGASATDTAYSPIVFRKGSTGGLVSTGATVVDTLFIPGYVGRSSNTIDSTASDWVASLITGTAPNFTLGTVGNTSPGNFAEQPLNHIGDINFAPPTNVNYAISTTTPTVLEGNSGSKIVSFTVTRSGNTDIATIVSYALDGTATSGIDYNTIKVGTTTATASGTLKFAAGETTKTISLSVVGDLITEVDETINLNLSYPNQTVAIAPATISISNDDKPPIISITGSSGIENSGSLAFTVKLSNASSQTITVDYNTSNDTAIAGLDYTALTGSLTFNPGVTTQTITIPILDDFVVESTESFFVNLTNPTNSSITTNKATGTITENDKVGFTILPVTPLVTTEVGGIANFNIQLTSQPTANVTLNLTSSKVTEGTLSVPSVTFTAANWNTPQTITVSGVDDGIQDDSIIYQIITSAAVSSDAKYNNLNPADLDVINIKNGDQVNNIITGSALADKLLQGTDSDDLIFGFAGNDVIVGGLGNDKIYGGLGSDTLTGGAGNDIFVFAKGDGRDTIKDFSITDDHIGLSGGLLFSGLSITQSGADTLIKTSTESLALLTGITASTLSASNFITY